jgi:glyoxylase-like metal-dependent hydrolase (beta-lactamase superfamily II)
MILRQYLHTEPVVAVSYLLGCPTKGVACIVDPVESPAFYLDAATRAGMRILCVIDTHVHADHLSSGAALATAADAEYILHESVEAAFPVRPVRDGEHINLGNTRLEVWHLPGHTPEHIALVVRDLARSGEPWFVITGHTLMAGDMGRTELATSAIEGAEALYESAQRLRRLPDRVEVMPGAFAGSACGRGLSGKTTSTIGFERRFNRAFAIEERDAFIEAMLRDIPAPPPGAAQIRARNLGRELARTG